MGTIAEDQRKLNKNKMKYPVEFKTKVRTSFPEDKYMNELLDENSFLLGGYLKRLSSKKFTVEELEKITETGMTDEYSKKYEQIKVAKELYDAFIVLYDEQYRCKGHFIKNGLERSSEDVLRDYQLRHGQIEIIKVKIDPVADRESHEASVRRLEQNAERRRVGEEVAKNMWCGGAGC